MMTEKTVQDLFRLQYYDMYLSAARKQWKSAQADGAKLEQFKKELEQLEGIDATLFDARRIFPLRKELTEKCVIVIILCAATLESYIYDYAARRLPLDLLDDLDKLGMKEKWVVIPQLVTGKRFPKDGLAFRLLNQLVKDRNYLIHNKSTPLAVPDKNCAEVISPSAKRMIGFTNSIYKKAEDALTAVGAISNVMDNLDPQENSRLRLDAKNRRRGKPLGGIRK